MSHLDNDINLMNYYAVWNRHVTCRCDWDQLIQNLIGHCSKIKLVDRFSS